MARQRVTVAVAGSDEPVTVDVVPADVVHAEQDLGLHEVTRALLTAYYAGVRSGSVDGSLPFDQWLATLTDYEVHHG